MAPTILVPVDFSDVTEKLLWEAVRLARGLGAGIHLIHVAQTHPQHVSDTLPSWPGMVGVLENERDTLRQKLDGYKQLVSNEGLDASAELLIGSPAHVILEEAARLKPEMIVLGSHGHGLVHHLVLGSVTSDVLKQAGCPVVVVPSKVVAAEPVRGAQ